MSRLSSAQLLAGLSHIGTGAATRHDTHAYTHFTLTGADVSDITALQHYPYLQSIDLSHNALESLSVLSACRSLRALDVSHNLLPKLLDFHAPRALQVVNASHNNITELGRSVLDNKYLQTLDLSVNRLTALDGIGTLVHLTRLDVSRNEIGNLSPVTCPGLISLDASGNFMKDVSSLSTSLQELRTLALDDNQITSLEGIEALTLLSSLSLASNQIASMEEVARLASLEQLVELDLSGNPLAEEEGYRVRLLHLLPNLERLDGVLIEASEVVAAHNAHGADAGMREAITRLYLPKDEATLPRDGVRPAAMVAEGAKGATLAPTILAETEFWSLLSERGFIGQWTEFLRVAKRRLPDARPDYADEEAAQGVKLDLSGVHLGEAGCWALSELLAVRSGDTIASVDLAHAFNPFSRWSSRLSDSYGARLLFHSLAGLTHLHSLRLSHCQLGRKGGVLLSGYLSTPAARTLRSLHLAHNQLGSNLTATSADGQLHVIDSCPGLRSVLAALADPTNTPAELEYLDLTSNQIDAQGTRLVAEYLAGRITHSKGDKATPAESLSALQLEDDQDEADASVEQAAEAVVAASPPSLRSIMLDRNPLSDEGIALLASALRTNQSLTYLSLRGDADRSVGVRGLVALSLSVSRYNRSLVKLDLSSNRRLFGAADEEASQVEAATALASTLWHATNGPNEAGELRELLIADTGLADRGLTILSAALARNSSLRVLDIGQNPVGEVGQDALFAAARCAQHLEQLRVGSIRLGQKSALRAAEWLKTTCAVRTFTTTVPAPSSVEPETAVWGFSPEPAESAPVSEPEQVSSEISELVLSTLSASLNVARGEGLQHVGLQNVGPHLAVVLSNLSVPLTTELPPASHEEQPDAEQPEEASNGEESGPAVVETGLLRSLDLSGNSWDERSLELLVSVVSRQTQCEALTLRHSRLSDDLLTNGAQWFERLVSAIVSTGSITKLDLSGTPLNLSVLEGIGAGLLGPDGLAVNTTLLRIDLADCGLDDLAPEEEDAPSKFLDCLAADGNGLTSLSLRSNHLSTHTLTRLVTALDANWNLRQLDLSGITVRGGEESLALLRSLVSHSISHGLHRLCLPLVKHAAGAAAARDGIIAAVARGWSLGVERATAFLMSQQCAPESILHSLAIDLGDSFETLTWQQKQTLAEAVRPLRQATATLEQESFRLVALTAGGKPIRVQTTATSCGQDLVENALAARLACQRM